MKATSRFIGVSGAASLWLLSSTAFAVPLTVTQFYAGAFGNNDTDLTVVIRFDDSTGTASSGEVLIQPDSVAVDFTGTGITGGQFLPDTYLQNFARVKYVDGSYHEFGAGGTSGLPTAFLSSTTPQGGLGFTFPSQGSNLADAIFRCCTTFERKFNVDGPPTIERPPVSGVPEPTTTALLALGLLGAGYARRRRLH